MVSKKAALRPRFTAVFLTLFFFLYFTLMYALPANKSGRAFGLNYNLSAYMLGLLLAGLGCLFLTPVATRKITARPAALRRFYGEFLALAGFLPEGDD